MWAWNSCPYFLQLYLKYYTFVIFYRGLSLLYLWQNMSGTTYMVSYNKRRNEEQL